jgi:hypothetical protein
MMKLFLLPLAAIAVSATLAHAQPAAESDRTVTYYANNPYVREKVLQQCADDPGHLQFNPDCVNAKKGDIADAARKGAGMFYHGQVPSPGYFSWDHEQRAATLGICRKMKPSQKVRYGGACEDAEASIEADQKHASGTLPQVPTVR